MRDTEYAYAVAYIHTLENKMLDSNDYHALLNAPSLQWALQYLSDKGYGMSSVDTKPDLELMLKNELAYTWNEVRNACPYGAPIDILLRQNDFHNLKSVLKAVFCGGDYLPLMIKPYILPPEEIYSAISKGKPQRLPEIVRDAVVQAYEIFACEQGALAAEVVLDKAFFRLAGRMAAELRSDFLEGWVNLNVTLVNMKIALRCVDKGKSIEFLQDCMCDGGYINADQLARAALRDTATLIQFISNSGYEKAAAAVRKSYTEFEKWCDNQLIKYAQAARYKSFGFEPIIAFLIGKQFELQMVRIIMFGLRGEIPPELLQERLRDTYV